MGRLFANKRERWDELLSAYMDGELSAEQRTRLESQLQADPALQAELDGLRHTVALMRDLPPVAIPRNFILSQAMAATAARPQTVRPPRPRRVRNVPFLTTATAIVSLMFVVILAGDLLFFGYGMERAAPASEPRMMLEAPAQAPLADNGEAVAVEMEAKVETETVIEVAEVPVEAELVAGDDEVAEQAIQDTSATAPSGGGGPTVEPATTTFSAITSPTVELDVAPAASTTMEPVPTASPTVEPAEVAEAEGIAAISPTAPPSPGEGVEMPEEHPPEEGAQPPPTRDWQDPQRASISPLRVIEIVLGLAALGLALATIWTRRARRR